MSGPRPWAGPEGEVRPHLRVMSWPGQEMKKYCLGRDIRLARSDTQHITLDEREGRVDQVS